MKKKKTYLSRAIPFTLGTNIILYSGACVSGTLIRTLGDVETTKHVQKASVHI